MWDATKEIAERMIQHGEYLKGLAEKRFPPRDPEARKQLMKSVRKTSSALDKEGGEMYEELLRRFHAWTGLEEPK
jgi:hypothetical protein